MTPQEATALVVSGAAALGAIGWLFKKARGFFRGVELAATLLKSTARTVDKELTPNSGSSIKDQVDRLAVQANTNADAIADVGGMVRLVADEVARHGHQSRAAMAIYRRALADQGIHLPVAPGEDGLTDDDLDLHRPTHREEPS